MLEVAAVLDEHRDREPGRLGRREADEPRVRSRAGVVWAVPVLPATVIPGMRARVPVPFPG